jgi:outer membrane protein
MEREIQRKEAKMYQTIYLEVTDAVEKYARIYKYTLILKFNREDMTSDDPQKIAMALQRQVVYYQADDDITDPVLKYLNNTYEANATSAGKPAPRTGSRPAATSRN